MGSQEGPVISVKDIEKEKTPVFSSLTSCAITRLADILSIGRAYATGSALAADESRQLLN